jgi:hypothetical protein
MMSVRVTLVASDRKPNSVGLKQKRDIIGSHKEKIQASGQLDAGLG